MKNPPQHPEGDFAVNLFSLANDATEDGQARLTFSGIGVYRPEMFDSIKTGESAKLVTLLRHYADCGQLGGELYRGDWTDVGTPERLAQLNAPLK